MLQFLRGQVFLLACFTFISIQLFSQSSEIRQNNVPCVCRTGYNQCRVTTLFMSCCSCCEPGTTCDTWSFLGFCGCGCENSTSSRYLYIDIFKQFLGFLDQQEIYIPGINIKFEELVKGLEVIDSKDARYVVPDAAGLAEFIQYYKQEIQGLSGEAQRMIKEFIGEK